MQLETCEQYAQGANLLFLNGKKYKYSKGIPHINIFSLIDYGLAVKTLERMANKVPIANPWDAHKAKTYDNQTLGSWIDSRVNLMTNTGKKMLRTTFTEIFMSDPSEVSLLHTLQLIYSLKSIEWIQAAKGGAQQDVVVGGMQAVAECLMEKLGDLVHLNSPVQCIKQDKSGVEVRTDKLLVRGKRSD